MIADVREKLRGAESLVIVEESVVVRSLGKKESKSMGSCSGKGGMDVLYGSAGVRSLVSGIFWHSLRTGVDSVWRAARKIHTSGSERTSPSPLAVRQIQRIDSGPALTNRRPLAHHARARSAIGAARACGLMRSVLPNRYSRLCRRKTPTGPTHSNATLNLRPLASPPPHLTFSRANMPGRRVAAADRIYVQYYSTYMVQ
jgi:hypothetical protein